MIRAAPRRSLANLAAILLSAALAAAACDAPQASARPSPTRTPEPTPAKTTYDLSTDVWYEGLVVHVGQAIAILDARGGTIDVTMTIENPNAESSTLDAAIGLIVAGQRIEPTRDSQVPSIPAKESRLALVSFELQAIGSVEDGVLEIGADPEHVARVPFTEAGGSAVTLQPIEITTEGRGSAGDLRVQLRGGILRWDLPDWSLELPATTQALTLTYDATYTGSFSGGFPFTSENIALRLPNGEVVETRRDGRSQSIELIGAGKTKKNLISRFEI
ncbi:MAG TPA: hypothetical protein VNL94_04530, partial [Candidatus Binatia bacterium]|nr:hypothetical protein [Candidatus Binatia bacterium]